MKAEQPGRVKQAAVFVRRYYEEHPSENIHYSFRFISILVDQAKLISKSVMLAKQDHQNVLVATWFCYIRLLDIPVTWNDEKQLLLEQYFTEVLYPESDRLKVAALIHFVLANENATMVTEQVISDAVNSQLAHPNFLENITLVQEEIARISGSDHSELYYSRYYYSTFLRTRFYTAYARQYFQEGRESNFLLLEKRIRKIEQAGNEKFPARPNPQALLTNKETDDLFKIAFRNYNQLISVADSKASLLINVNSIIISVLLAFVISKVEKNVYLLWPTSLLLLVCVTTILLSILASRPQMSRLMDDKKSNSYQRFFFGSFDLIDPGFRVVGWDQYYRELSDLFSTSRENVYLEVYKESYNVRKVLSQKFNYLSKAYWVFIIGLLFSIVAFVICIQHSVR